MALLAGARQKGESSRAIQGCNDYLRMGPSRSVAELYRRYAKTDIDALPTRSLATLKHWAARYGWTARGERYDAQLEEEKNARAQAIMSEGLALAYERVAKLHELAEFLEAQLYETGEDGVYHNVWVPDVKQIGNGQWAERVDIERFNSSLISEYRAALDDLAKETGGRAQKVDQRNENSGEVTVRVVYDRSEDGVADGD